MISAAEVPAGAVSKRDWISERGGRRVSIREP